jgi:hypothetical protein
MLNRPLLKPFTMGCVATMAFGVVLSAASVKFTSTWKSPDASAVNFAGRKVAALVISQDESLRISGEEALVRELTARGMDGVATYRIAPKEELRNPDRAMVWYQKANVEGVVAIRPVSADKRQTYTPDVWINPYYSTFTGYYGYGWGSVYIPGSVQNETFVVVENTIYSVPRNALLWAAVSETKNPKTLQQFIQDLVKESVKELQKQGLARNVRK